MDQNDSVTFGIGSVDPLIRTFSGRGSLHNVPVTGSQEKGLSKFVHTFDTMALF